LTTTILDIMIYLKMLKRLSIIVYVFMPQVLTFESI